MHDGLPVREPDYEAHPPLERVLTLPDGLAIAGSTPAQASHAWAEFLGHPRVALVRSVERARELLLRTAEVRPGEPVAVPANATRGLVDAIKRHGAKPGFLPVGPELRLHPASAGSARTRVAIVQPVGGLPGGSGLFGPATWLDHADSVPFAQASATGAKEHATLWGLHLSDDPEWDGALVAFADASFHAAFVDLLGEDDLPDASRALAQHRRHAGERNEPGLATRQAGMLAEAHRGLAKAAGLPLLPAEGARALAHHVAVRIPGESDASTFYAYVRGENTPVRWLPEVRPIHPAALYEPGARALATAADLARWLLVPVGPDYTEEELRHAVLGVVKAAEYLGVRWRTAPARAAEYAQMLDEMYGPDHDAYRPVFDTSISPASET